jgi:NADPH2:quinone reductase
MRAWRQCEFGEPRDVLRLDELPETGPAEGTLVVAPEAVGVNMPDLLVCRGGYQELPPFPFVLGSELAGTVIDPGSGPFASGQRVMALARPPAGALAERVPVLVQDTVAVPDAVSSEVAASIPVNYVTAYLALHTRARLAPGETVLVQGGAGGVGSAAVQLALAHGARVIATAIDEPRAEACRALGAELVLNPLHDDVVAAVLEHTVGRGVDVAIDPVGGEAFDQCRRTMAFEGRLVVVGFAGGGIATLKTNHPVLRNYAVFGVNNSLYLLRQPDVHRAVREVLLDLAAAGKVSPLFHGVWSFDDAPAALGALADGAVIGKALVRLEAPT